MIRPNRYMGSHNEFIFDGQPEEKIYDELKTKSDDNKHTILRVING